VGGGESKPEPKNVDSAVSQQVVISEGQAPLQTYHGYEIWIVILLILIFIVLLLQMCIFAYNSKRKSLKKKYAVSAQASRV
jgi:hypothetical protein